MAVLRLSGFQGAIKALHPKLLPENVGVSSVNQRPGRGDLRPLRAPLTVASVPAGRNTIYRMGRDVVSDTDYWLSWTGVVHAVRGFSADDTTERTYFTGDGEPKWTDNTKALATAPYPTSARTLGVPKPGTALTAVASGGTSTNADTRYYTYTYVTDIGEESAPADPSQQLDCKLDDTVTLTGFATPPAGNYGITLMRVYRTASGTTGSDFLFLRELPVGTANTTDDNRDLGEVLPTTYWDAPPADLKWLTGLWNGMLAGISGKAVRYSEPYTPYAWPKKYEVTMPDSTPVALAVFGQTLLILTTTKPRLAMGGDPASMDDQAVEFEQACLSARSTVSLGHGVVWAAPDGLAYMGSSGPRIITQGILSRDDWQAMKPETIIGARYEGAYLGFYNDGGGVKGFLIDPVSPQGIYYLDFGGAATYLDTVTDGFYLLDGLNIKKWDAGSNLTALFRSKEFRMPQPTVAFACAEVVADVYPVTFRLYADGALKHTQTVTSREPFRLPSGYRANDYQVELQTQSPVQMVTLAHSMKELAQA
jgi:hypothetical protein